MSLERYTTQDYELKLGTHEEQSTYQIWNREHNVMEYQDYLLPRVLDTLTELQGRLDKIRSKKSEAETGGSNVVTFGGKHDGSGVH